MTRRRSFDGYNESQRKRGLIESEAVQDAWAEVMRRNRGHVARTITSPFSAYANDPLRFIQEVLGQRLWEGQEAIVRALMKHKRVAVRSTRKGGKSHIAAAIVEAFMQTAPTICIATAPTERQIRDILCARMRSLHSRAKAKLMGDIGVQSLRIDSDWFMIGVAASDPENVLGFHAGVEPPDADPLAPGEFEKRESVFDLIEKTQDGEQPHRLLIVFDESVGIPQAIFDALEGSMSGENVYAIMLANPRMAFDCGHAYANAFRNGSGWWRIHFAAEEPREDPTPGDECFHNVPEWLLTKKWIEERRLQWGEESALFQSDVLGCFTTAESENQFVPLHVLQAASKWDIYDDELASSRHIGCDLAGGETAGADFCVATLWINGVLSCLHRWKSNDVMHSLSILEALAETWAPNGQRIPWSNIHVDGTGIGKTATDRLRERGLFVDSVNFGAKARYDWKRITGDMKFRDRKSELYWVMRRALQEGIAMIPPKYAQVWRELQWHTHKMVSRGNETAMACVEDKKLMREKYGRSPDEADAAVIAWSRSGARPTFRLMSAGSTISGR